MKTQTQPDLFVPVRPDDFIGGARQLAHVLKVKAKALRASGTRHRALFFGPPGVGKTRLAELFARELTGENIVNGESASNQRCFNLDIDKAPRLRSFKENACQLIEGTKP